LPQRDLQPLDAHAELSPHDRRKSNIGNKGLRDAA